MEKTMKRRFTARAILTAAVIATLPSIAHAAEPPKRANATQLERGRYVLKIGGCNDCHTPGYLLNAGKIPEAQWLTGDRLGWRGPWGTTYAINLRMYMQDLTEAQWLQKAKTLKSRPPMPWFTVREMTSGDLRAIYAFIRHLGPGGDAAPAYVPPDREPAPPFVLFPAPPK
jgi:mono/diheme cytochrome c family protein